MEIVLGVLLGLAGATAIAVGIVRQAEAAAAAPSRQLLKASLLVTLARSPRWLLGTALAALGWLCQLAGFAVAPVTVVQPAMAFTVVVVFVLGVRSSGVRAPRREVGAVAAVTAGMVAIAIVAPDNGGSNATGTAVWVALIVLGALSLLPMAARRWSSATVWWPPAAGAAFALAAIATKFLSDARGDGLIVAAFWLVVVGASSAVGGVDEMSAFHARRPVSVVPVVLSIELLIPVLAAPTLFGESWPAGTGPRLALAAGLVVLTCGAVVLGRNQLVAGLSAAGAEG